MNKSIFSLLGFLENQKIGNKSIMENKIWLQQENESDLQYKRFENFLIIMEIWNLTLLAKDWKIQG